MQKILIITYYWPPAGGPGVQRWLKFVKYLPQFGIAPVVYLPENPHYALRDESLVSEVPVDATYLYRKIREPYRWAALLAPKKTKRISSGIIRKKDQSIMERLLLWIRGNLYIPDARRSWVRPSVAFLKEYISETGITTVVTTGPPHSMHLIGMKLKSVLPIRWVADFRDPWTSIGYHGKLKLTHTARRKHKQLEKQVLNSADKIIVTSKTTGKEFQALTTKPVCVITNGFDETNTPSTTPDDSFTISHIGSLLTGRNPVNLWEILSELVAVNPEFQNKLRLQFIGVVSDEVLESIRRFGLDTHLNLKDYVIHEKAIQYQRSSQLLLLVEMDNPETQGIIPGKLFEYMASHRPILAIGPEHWEAGDMIRESGTGEVFDYKSKTGLKKVILAWFQMFLEGRLTIKKGNFEKFSRKNLTGELAVELQWE